VKVEVEKDFVYSVTISSHEAEVGFFKLKSSKMAGRNKKERNCLKWKSIKQLKTIYNMKVRFCPMLSDVLKSIALFDGSQALPRPAFSYKNGSIKDENEWDSLVERYRLEKTEVLGEQPVVLPVRST
jgi:hypothetical protein